MLRPLEPTNGHKFFENGESNININSNIKKQRKRRKHQNNSLSLIDQQPITKNQEITYQEYNKGNNLFLHGVAGTGKSFVSLYLALSDILFKNSFYNKIYIVKSAVPSRNVGFLPGNQKEKAKVYEAPYYMICSELFNRGDAYDILKNQGLIEFTLTSFIRGTTFKDCIVIFDEFQNTTFHEFETVITRMGENTKLLICGDKNQSDLVHEKLDYQLIEKIFDKMGSIKTVQFDYDDIVRSGFLKDYLINKDKLLYVRSSSSV